MRDWKMKITKAMMGTNLLIGKTQSFSKKTVKKI